MSSPNAAFRFLSWARRGAASHIAIPDAVATTTPARVPIPVAINFNSGADARTASLSLEMLGPGDVVSLDPRAVVRTFPPAETRDAEPNYFPLIEFDQVDLPWRYTPRSANAVGQVRPWFCLAVVEEGQDHYEAPDGTRACGKVTIARTNLPRLDQSWAWAHVQISGDGDGAGGEATSPAIITAQPERAVARLLCPRRLEPNKIYWAILVPTFEVGRLAGLGRELGGAALEPAWSDTGPDPVELPVYYRWRFGTGQGGDFEELVRQLTPQVVPSTVGSRPLDVSQPGTLPPAATEAVPLGGALCAPDGDPWSWPADLGQRAMFIEFLSALLDYADVLRHDGGSPLIAPPLYGAWHARRWRLAPADPPIWFRDLNQDVRARIGAALGTEVVQTQQEALMASAWDQLAGIREANDQLRKAQLARAMAERLHARFVQPSNADTVLTFTGPALGHLRPTTKTVRALVQNSPPRLALVSGAFRRLARPLGPLGRRQQRKNLEEAPLITRVNAGDYNQVLADEPPKHTALPTWGWLSTSVDAWPHWNNDPNTPLDATLTGGQVQSFGAQPADSVWDPEYGAQAPPDSGNPDSPSMTRFRASAIAFAERNLGGGPGQTLHRLDMTGVRTSVAAGVDPKVTIPAALRHRLVGRPDFVWNPPDPIEPVMAHPEFPQPMYKPLSERSPEWILPGLEAIKANSVGLAVTNQAFIEAYMVGLNHEMARELLWREYPTDQRGSYFRQFWDVAGLAPTPVPETSKDIALLHAWGTSALGAHSPRLGGPHLVLLVRGEVLRRYPGTLVYAQRAQGPISDPALVEGNPAVNQKRPVFGGRLDPDISFFGFELTKEEAKGGSTGSGWFFVFEEQPGEPRFGLDAHWTAPGFVTSWDELSWDHLVDPADPQHDEHLAAIKYIDLLATFPDTTHVTTSGGARWRADVASFPSGADHAYITFQRPVRVAMHGSLLLP